ncbi:MAG: MBL fold metallo-hydrolase [Clostridiaceae bacterium]
MKIADGIEMLEIPSINTMGKQTVICPTVIWDEDTVIMVDTGYPGQLPLIREAMEKAGADFEKLKMIILTHHDIDHIGTLSSILRVLPGKVKVLAHKEEKPYINGEKTPLKLAGMEVKLNSMPENMKEFYKKIKSAFQNSKADVDETLKDGDELPFCGGIKVIFTPGHTLGHICLYLEKSKTLIAGDLLRVVDGKLMKADPSINFDTELSNESLKKLQDYDIEKVICYHGGMCNDNVNHRIFELVAQNML